VIQKGVSEMPEPLTDRQREVFEFVRGEICASGVPPTLQEIGIAMGIKSLRGVTDHLDALERKGWLERTGAKGTARCWRVLCDEPASPGEPDAPSVALPLVGAIAAGVPITAIEHIEEYVAVPQDFVRGSSECFILRVQGDSMIGDSICEGDLVVIRQQSTARSGDIVAVQLEEEATLKHYVKIGARIELHSSNPRYDPIPVTQENSQILGKLVGLIRRYD
jgi:repressor LexA